MSVIIVMTFLLNQGGLHGGGKSVQHRTGHWHAAEQTEGDCWKCTEEASGGLCDLCKRSCRPLQQTDRFSWLSTNETTCIITDHLHLSVSKIINWWYHRVVQCQCNISMLSTTKNGGQWNSPLGCLRHMFCKSKYLVWEWYFSSFTLLVKVWNLYSSLCSAHQCHLLCNVTGHAEWGFFIFTGTTVYLQLTFARRRLHVIIIRPDCYI